MWREEKDDYSDFFHLEWAVYTHLLTDGCNVLLRSQFHVTNAKPFQATSFHSYISWAASSSNRHRITLWILSRTFPNVIPSVFPSSASPSFCQKGPPSLPQVSHLNMHPSEVKQNPSPWPSHFSSCSHFNSRNGLFFWLSLPLIYASRENHLISVRSSALS